ncbi:MAG: hypothetical protein AB2551_12995 [Candidatus Thiodiazotropha sp.]
MDRQGTVKRFLETKLKTLSARARRLAQLTPEQVGLDSKDRAFAPSAAHFQAANSRLQSIDRDTAKRIAFAGSQWRKAPPHLALLYMALVEREVDRARRTYGMFFEIFSQRGSGYGAILKAHDAIASDCYGAIRRAAPMAFRGPLLKPLTYLEHGYSPATYRRGVTLSRLLGGRNPFPLIRIPWDRDNPWQAVFLHEVAHNIQADLGLWQENKRALTRRLAREGAERAESSDYLRWDKEIFADLVALLLGGPAAAWGMLDFLAHPAAKTMTYKPGGAHPTGYLRAMILAEMLHRMGFSDQAGRIRKVWRCLYPLNKGHRIPRYLTANAHTTIARVVDEIAFQAKRGLAQRALVDVIPFTDDDERSIRQGSRHLLRGRVPDDLPPRFLVSASRYALTQGADVDPLSELVTRHLVKQSKTAGNNRPSIRIAHAA